MKRFIQFVLSAILMLSCTSAPDSYLSDGSQVISERISNERIMAFAEDGHGHVWIATERGLNKFDGHRYHQYFHSESPFSLPDNAINSMIFTSEGDLMVGTECGLALMDDYGRFAIVGGDMGNVLGLTEIPSGKIFATMHDHVSVYDEESGTLQKVIDVPYSFGQANVFAGSGQTLWVVTFTRIFCYDALTYALEASYETPFPVSRSLMAGDGCIWLAGSRAVSVFDSRSRRYVRVSDAVKSDMRLSSSDIHSFYETGQGDMLMSTTTEGVFLFKRTENVLIHQSDNLFPFDIPDHLIRTFFSDSAGNLWIGSEDRGWFLSGNFNTGPFGKKSVFTGFFKDKSVVALENFRDKGLFISTHSDGLFFQPSGSSDINPVSIGHVLDQHMPGSNTCNGIHVAANGDIWLAFLYKQKVVRCRFEEGVLYLLDSFDVPAPISFAETADGTVWVGGAAGTLYFWTGEDMASEQIFPITRLMNISTIFNMDDTHLLLGSAQGSLVLYDIDGRTCRHVSDMSVTCLYEDRSGALWVGTDDLGLMQMDEGFGFTALDGIGSVSVVSMVEDQEGCLWIGTDSGLKRISSDREVVYDYYDDGSTGGNLYNQNASVAKEDGTLVFGGTHGITIYDTVTDVMREVFPVVFETLHVHNRLVCPGEGAPIAKPMSENPAIRIRHLQNGMTISFSAICYDMKEQIRYSYMMDGFDSYWIEAGSNQDAYYSNLPAGRYTFRVRAGTGDSWAVFSENAISVRVLPAPWLSWWAVLSYVLIVLLVLFFLINHWVGYQKEKAQTRELSHLNAMQMNFFSNIAHEFRTPLTMIAGPVAMLGKSDRIAGQDRRMLTVMQRSVNWMLHLVSQMLDFNRLEGDRLTLKVAKKDIIPCLKEVMEVFYTNAQTKNVKIELNLFSESVRMWVDEDKLTKVMMNLLSNAMKFTPSGGVIEVALDVSSLEEAGSVVRMTVSDTGPGIPPGEENKIFERYHQISVGSDSTGSGIGLYYARSLAEIHHGSLKAWNREDGRSGAVFELILPMNEASYSECEKDSSDSIQHRLFPVIEVQDKSESLSRNDRKSVLVVDDDIDIANYLKILLQTSYKVNICFDSDTALAYLEDEQPDIILCDVMMPGRDGFELCRTIKKDINMSHIPVILVTAKAQVSDQVAGLEKGADAYVTKPFNPEYIMALIGSMMENRAKLWNRLGLVSRPSEVEDAQLSPQDKYFMKELYGLMEREISNPELDVTSLTEHLKISRTKLYYKVKGLTGENPGHLFRRYKLNKAAQLILEGKKNMSEVADSTGFSSLSYFSSCFKRQFGVPPSEYRG